MRSPLMPPSQMMTPTTTAHSSLPAQQGVYLATNGIFKDNTNVSDCRYINAIACIRKTADAFKDGLTYYEFAQTIKSVELACNIPTMSVDLSSCSLAANPLPIRTVIKRGLAELSIPKGWAHLKDIQGDKLLLAFDEKGFGSTDLFFLWFSPKLNALTNNRRCNHINLWSQKLNLSLTIINAQILNS